MKEKQNEKYWGCLKHNSMGNTDAGCYLCRKENEVNTKKIKEACIKANAAKFFVQTDLYPSIVNEDDIHLADVLLAIRNMLIIVDAEGHFYRCEMKLTDKIPKIGMYLGEWNLRDDNLDHQSLETKAFISALL